MIFLFIFCFPQQSNQGAEDDDDIVTVETVATESDDVYVTPSKPSKAYIAETFDSPEALGKRWIKSKAKKPDVEEEIAQYVGM